VRWIYEPRILGQIQTGVDNIGGGDHRAHLRRACDDMFRATDTPWVLATE
jgi:hypothetical protein